MPNWVSNIVRIEGEQDKVQALVKQVSQPYTTNFPEHKYDEVAQSWVKVPNEQKQEVCFSFWNIVSPTDLDAYYNEEERRAPIDASASEVMETIRKNFAESNNWYNWNVRNWGTKWDSVEPKVLDEGDGFVVYQFETAWAPPTAAFIALSAQHPDLKIRVIFMEEFGWGGEGEFIGGQETILHEWDDWDSMPDHIKDSSEVAPIL